MDDQYQVFLNEKVSSRFSALPKAEKQRFAEKMRFLAAGIWEGGILVKKLAGAKSKVVFEARISKGDRVLFTLGRPGERGTVNDGATGHGNNGHDNNGRSNNGRGAAYVWAYLKHDEVDRKARVGMPDNAPFLDFPSVAEEKIDTLYLDSTKEYWYSQEDLEDKVESDYGPQKWNVLDDDEWERAISLEANQEIAYHLYLSQEQYSILTRPAPILLSGTAGSGKTTLALYYLSRKEFLGKKRLFATYSPYLRDFAAKLYRGLVRGDTIEEKPPLPEFLTMEEAQRRCIPSASPLADPGKLVGLEAFKTLIAANPLSRKFDPELLWEEIRSIIKGAMPPFSLKRLETLAQRLCSGSATPRERQELAAELANFTRFSFGGRIDAIVAAATSFESLETFVNALGTKGQEGETQAVLRCLEFLKKKKELFARPLLSLEEYLYMGEKRAPSFPHDRAELYSLAAYYQKKLEEKGLYDEIDLAKRALAERKRSDTPEVWDLVVCDEIQDMTDAHVELLFDFAANRNKVFFAGDERQSVNPSGFRWEAVRARFYEAGIAVPDFIKLSMNFRSSGSIVELGNALLELKKTYVGAGKFESPETWKFAGKAPVLVEGIGEKAILDIVRQSGADRIILTRSDEEKARLKTLLGTELVFTIFEAKGLEFDTVLLWKFIENHEKEGLWEAMGASAGNDFGSGAGRGASVGKGHGEITEDMIPHLRHELNLLYVAVARARSILAIYDGDKPSAVWNAGRLPSIVVRATETSFLVESWSKASTPEAWASQGDGLYQRGYYRVAAECYRHAGLTAKEDLCLAYAAFGEGDYKEAGPRFERTGQKAKAALCFEKTGNLDKAQSLYASLGDKAAAKRLMVLSLEKAGNWLEAGKLRLKMGETAKALENWERGNEYALLAAGYLKKKDYTKAGRCFEKLGDFDKAARYYKKAKDIEKAAEMLLLAGQEEKAVKMFKTLGGTSGYLEFCKRSGKPDLIAGAYLEMGKYEDAGRLFKEYLGSTPEAEKVLRDQALAFSAKRKFERAGLLFSVLGAHAEAGEAYKKAWNNEKAAQEFLAAGRYYDAALLFEYSKRDEDALAAWKSYIPNSHEHRIQKLNSLRDLFWHSIRKNPTKSKDYNQGLANDLFEEATHRFESGEYLNALAIYILFNEKEYVVKSLLPLEDDALAVYVVCMTGEYELWRDYRERRKTIHLDSVKASSYIEKHYISLGNIRKASENKIDGLFLLLNDVSDSIERNNFELQKINFEYYILAIEFDLFEDRKNVVRWGSKLLKLLASLRNYSRIITFGRAWRGESNSDTQIEAVIDSLDELSVSYNDAVLTLCKSTIKNLPPDNAIIGKTMVDEQNWNVMRAYPEKKEEVIEFLTRMCMTHNAADVIQSYDGFAKAAAYLETHYLLKEAAAYYEKAFEWDKAKAIYTELKNPKAIARLYEHKGDFANAINQWKKLGYPKQVERLQQKQKKLATLEKAPLFDFGE